MKKKITHKKILNIIEVFGLQIEQDYWETEGKEYIRLVSNRWIYDYSKGGNLVIYKADGYEKVMDEIRNSMIETGKNIRSREIRDMIMKPNNHRM